MKAKDEEIQTKESIPGLSKGIYKNYSAAMTEKNQKRKKEGLSALHIRTYEEWSGSNN